MKVVGSHIRSADGERHPHQFKECDIYQSCRIHPAAIKVFPQILATGDTGLRTQAFSLRYASPL
jgi:hypothetical protein